MGHSDAAAPSPAPADGWSLDHVVVLVDDLDQAVADYTALGFTVFPGGVHTGEVSHNALICFADGTYLELFRFMRTVEGHQWWHHQGHGPGLIDVALLPRDIDADVAAARSRGLTIDGPDDGGRLRPDGVRLAWKAASPTAVDLPFLCADVTPRSLRVPAAPVHANGATSIAEVGIAVHDPTASAARYAALLGRHDQTATVHVGGTRLRLDDARPTAVSRLATRGEGPAWLVLGGLDVADLDPARTHGVPIAGAA